eukprot:6625918-Ditylum_brightwellii.AAC.1
MAKYLGAVLNELGITQRDPIIIYEDNAAAIMMANVSKPNGRTQHINISSFVLQEWEQCGD